MAVWNCGKCGLNNQKVNPDAEFIPKIGAKELLDRDQDDLVVERIVLEMLTRSQNMKQIQIINGLNEGNITRALNGKHAGAIIYKDKYNRRHSSGTFL